MKKCPMCLIKIKKDNVARKEGTNEIKLDIYKRSWCKGCVESYNKLYNEIGENIVCNKNCDNKCKRPLQKVDCNKVKHSIECMKCGYPFSEAMYPDNPNRPLACKSTEVEIGMYLRSKGILDYLSGLGAYKS